jgi:ABC-type polar amino acid transport system ATPase subunit
MKNVTSVIVTHEMDSAFRIATRLILLRLTHHWFDFVTHVFMRNANAPHRFNDKPVVFRRHESG